MGERKERFLETGVFHLHHKPTVGFTEASWKVVVAQWVGHVISQGRWDSRHQESQLSKDSWALYEAWKQRTTTPQETTKGVIYEDDIDSQDGLVSAPFS